MGGCVIVAPASLKQDGLELLGLLGQTGHLWFFRAFGCSIYTALFPAILPLPLPLCEWGCGHRPAPRWAGVPCGWWFQFLHWPLRELSLRLVGIPHLGLQSLPLVCPFTDSPPSLL